MCEAYAKKVPFVGNIPALEENIFLQNNIMTEI
jgi:hypothetical protein